MVLELPAPHYWSFLLAGLCACDGLDALPERSGLEGANSTARSMDAEGHPALDAESGRVPDLPVLLVPDGASPQDATSRVDAELSTPRPDAWSCQGACAGSAPLATMQLGVCQGLQRTCVVETCTWVDAVPSPDTVPEFEASETRCDSLDNDCDGLIDEAEECLVSCPACDGQVDASEATTHFGPAAEAHSGDCDATGTAGWHRTLRLNDIVLRWTYAADCAVPAVGDAVSDYPGRWVEWELDVPAHGEYLLQTRVAARDYRCPPRLQVPEVHYALVDRSTLRVVSLSGPIALPSDGDARVTIFESALIGPETHSLVLFDHMAEAGPCGLVAGGVIADPPPVLLVETLLHVWVRPVR